MLLSFLFIMDSTSNDKHWFSQVHGRTKSLAGPILANHFGPKARLSTADFITIYDPGSTRLNWRTDPQSVVVIKKARDADVMEPFINIVQCLLKHNMHVFVERSVFTEEVANKFSSFLQLKGKLSAYGESRGEIDFVICLGGDGTLLHANSLFQTSVPPVMAFHLGSLGFLAPFDIDDYDQQINCVLSGEANLTLRSRLQCTLSESESANVFTGESLNDSFVVLNDVVIDRGASPYLVNIDLYADGQLLTCVQGDGLIISTPTGSTAYAVAAGASIIHPGVPAIMITPICPHSLSFRPIVVPAGCDLKVRISDNARDDAWVCFDGRSRRQLSKGVDLRITTSIYPLPSICCFDQMYDWFNGLAECLHWNVRKIQKPLD